MFSVDIKKNNFHIYIYYAVMLCVMVFSENILFLHSSFMRILFTIAVFVPAMFKYRFMLPVCIIAFYTMMSYSTFYPLVPNQFAFYILVTVATILISKSFSHSQNILFLIFMFFIFINNSILDSELTDLFFTLLLFYLLAGLKFADNKHLVFSLMNGYCLVSILLGINYILFYSTELAQTTNEFTRVAWRDPNYFSCIIGMGAVCSLIMLLKFKSHSIAFKIFWLVTFISSIIAQFLTGSRGGILATGVAVIIYLFLSNIKTSYKILALISCIIFIVFLYTYGYIDFMIHRIEADDGTGSNRTLIWAQKLNAFSNESENILTLVFGVGSNKSYFLGSKYPIGFHNDYISFLCTYGLFGILFLLLFFIYPILKSHVSVKIETLSLVSFLMVVLLTLEPLSYGYVAYWGLLFTIHKLSTIKDKDFTDMIENKF